MRLSGPLEPAPSTHLTLFRSKPLSVMAVCGILFAGLLLLVSCQSQDTPALEPSPELGLLGPPASPGTSEEQAAEKSVDEYKVKRLNRDLQRSITETIS